MDQDRLLRTIRDNAPCLNCEDRAERMYKNNIYVGCHSNCERYATYKEKVERIKAARKKSEIEHRNVWIVQAKKMRNKKPQN